MIIEEIMFANTTGTPLLFRKEIEEMKRHLQFSTILYLR